MAFSFLDPGPLRDRELSLVAPQPSHVEAAWAAIRHPMSLADPASQRTTRRQLEEFVHAAPQGRQEGDPLLGRVPSYYFFMWLSKPTAPPWPTWGSGQPPVLIGGGVSLRVGDTADIELYNGHIGYNVHPPVRGNHYAERSVRLILPLAARHGLKTIWITCNPDNIPSRRTCERLGGELVEIVELPPDHVLRQRGEHHKCRYRLRI